MASLQPAAGTDDEGRYVFERTLGQGGAGAVYLVRDRETGEQLALKKLLRVDAKTVLRLKREFRALADMHHANLVKLYDLGHARDAWFLTMEYVPGTDLRSYLGRLSSTGVDLARLLATFHQLACGVRALHGAGMLHRDLKPSNVLVSDQDRVVVLDFGLVRELDEQDSRLTEDGVIAGTPVYMAPEQGLDKQLTAASDWYAFGVMLYEALGGQPPFSGAPLQVLRRKLSTEAPSLETLAPDVPRYLVTLCEQLLRRDPAARPNGEEILRALAPAPKRPPAPLIKPAAAQHASPQTSSVSITSLVGESTLHTDSAAERQSAPELFGREQELEELWDELERAREGSTAVVHVRGASGAGKSALVEKFLGQVEASHRGIRSESLLTLRSRCYEREAMPFKALDGVMDALVRHLASLNDVEVGHMLPTDIAVLARLFPVLERLHAVQRLLATGNARADLVQDRQRAEGALRELFSRLAARTPLVLWIDDLQWGDLDSASILASWLDKPIEAPLLLVLSYRSEEVTTSSCLRTLLARAADGGTTPAHVHTISLHALAANAVEALCAARLGARAGEHPELVARIVREAQGSPFLAFQLAALAEAKIGRGDGLDTLSVAELIEQAGALLPDEARALLATLAVAGRPMHPKLALRAAGVKRDGRSHVHALRGLNLVRTRDVAGERLLECYHDRVRESVQASLDAGQRRQLHENLLRVLEFSGKAESDWLHSLALGANQRDQALHYGLLAAERATATLAFERAAELFQQCLQLAPDHAANGGELWTKLAFALACCGRGARAAEAFLEAAKHAAPEVALTLTRFAASHLIRSGRFDEGETQVRKVLDAMNIRVPASERGMLAEIVWEMARLKLRGTAFTPRKEQDLPANLLAQLDVIDSLGAETQSYDPIRSALLNARGLRAALDAGEPSRITTALLNAATMAAGAGRARPSEELLARAAELAQAIGTERAHACVLSARALCAFLHGRLNEVIEPSYEAERLLRADSSHDYYRRFTAVSARIGALYVLGEQKRFLSELRAALQEARATDNVNAQLQMALNQTVAEELEGQPELSIARLDRQRTELPQARFGTLHVLHLAAVMSAGAATHELDWAEAHYREAWPAYERSRMRRNATLSMLLHTLRARLRLSRFALQRETGDPASLVSEDVRGISKVALPWSKAGVAHVRARVAALRGEQAQATQLFRQSSELYAACDRPSDSIRERYAAGVLMGGEEGEMMRSEAEQKMRAMGYADPVRAMQRFYPELLKWK